MYSQLVKRLFFRKSPDSLRYTAPLIVLGSIVAMAISLSIGLRQSVWFDEAYSIMLAKQSWSQLVALTAVDTHPPLYYLLLKGWAAVFGWSELALRSLSVLALGGAIVMASLLVRRLFGDRVALTTLAVMVVSPFLLRYGFEIRMYAVASLIGVVATYALVWAQDAKTVRQRWQRYAVYAVLVAVGMYTLYYLALLWLAHVAWLLWLTWREKPSIRHILRAPWVVAYVGSVVLFVPWLPTLIGQFSNGALTSVTQSMTLENMLSIVSLYTIYEPIWRLGPLSSLVVLFMLIVLVWVSTRAFRLTTGHQRASLVLFAFYTLVPVAALVVICMGRPMYVERYMAHVAIGGSMFIGVALGLVYPRVTTLKKRWMSGVFGVLLAGVVQLAMIGNYNFQRLFHPPFKQAAGVITQCDTQNVVVASEPMVAMELTYYLPSCPIHFYSTTRDLRGGYAPLRDSPLLVQNVADVAHDARQIYYVYYDQPLLTMPDGFTLANRSSYGALTVDRFSAALRG